MLFRSSIVVYDIFRSFALNSGYAEMYNPGTSTWASISPGDGSANGTLPVLSSDALGAEFGPTLRLQDGRILEIGANGLTALYTPGTPRGTWAAGPVITGTLSNAANPGGSPASFGSDDAPGATLPNGHVLISADAGPASVTSNANTTDGSATVTGISSTALLQVGWGVAQANRNSDVIPANTTIASVDSATQVTLSNSATASGTTSLIFGGTFSAPTQLFDFNPAGAGTITPLTAGSPFDLSTTGAYTTRMVVLPTGQVLFGTGGSVAVYTPDGTASPTLRPIVNNIT